MRYCIIILLLTLSLVHVPMPLHAQDIRIGAIYSKTGSGALTNVLNFTLLRFAVELVNEAGGVKGRKVVVIEYDDRSTALGGRLAAKAAVKDGVLGVVGPAWSSIAMGVGRVLQEEGIPMLATTATVDAVTRLGDSVFRVCFTDSIQGVALAEFALQYLKAENAVMFVNADMQYSSSLAGSFSEHFAAGGGEILWQGDYLHDATDFQRIISKAMELDPDVVLLPGLGRDSGLIIRQAYNMGFKAIFLGGDGWSGMQRHPFSYQQEFMGYYSGHWHKDLPLPPSRSMLKAYRQRVGEGWNYDLDSGGPLAYDAFNVLVDAIGRATELTPAAVRDALAATDGFEGATGTYSFGPEGDPVKNVLILKLDGPSSSIAEIITP